ncbi:malate:quinone oxidoreductase [Nocardia sp. CA-290969]|uniref:malate:quinone oxidoreductase n=1 Tax=Nocardia sp. CA-290969 TaxID=3239986 RepID=UPI003D9020F5
MKTSSRIQHIEVDVVLIGGGIMSATLGSMLAVLEPDLRVVLLEKADALATESSGPWNNAGTGHSGFCELNYMPDPANADKPESIARQFLLTREWWSYLADKKLLDPATFIHHTPHMDIVFGQRDIAYLRERFTTMSATTTFEGMEFTEDPAVIEQWAPLLMQGRISDEPVAATRIEDGTDVDFGALTRGLAKIIESEGGSVMLGHDVRAIDRDPVGRWVVSGRAPSGKFEVSAGRVFVGAGGHALRLLQTARLPEVRGYAVLPVGAAFFRCSVPGVVAQHNVKAYSQARVGAPPMSVPHMDKRIVDGNEYLMFGPFATFSTKLLKHGRLSDVFTTLRWNNLHVIVAAMLQNVALIVYLIGELLARPRAKFSQLQHFYPEAKRSDWEFVPAGQRAQLVTPHRRRIGVLQQGTELVVGGTRTIGGLLGASPGASTAVPIMLDLLDQWFPGHMSGTWRATLANAVPSNNSRTVDAAEYRAALERTAESLGLTPGASRSLDLPGTAGPTRL